VTPEAGIEQAKYLLYHSVRLAPKNLPLKNSVQIFGKYMQLSGLIGAQTKGQILTSHASVTVINRP
jgi:hypothetical protein